jgi:hypothetical protein
MDRQGVDDQYEFHGTRFDLGAELFWKSVLIRHERQTADHEDPMAMCALVFCRLEWRTK